MKLRIARKIGKANPTKVTEQVHTSEVRHRAMRRLRRSCVRHLWLDCHDLDNPRTTADYWAAQRLGRVEYRRRILYRFSKLPTGSWGSSWAYAPDGVRAGIEKAGGNWMKDWDIPIEARAKRRRENGD